MPKTAPIYYGLSPRPTPKTPTRRSTIKNKARKHQNMGLCPFCGGKADSKHHIIPKALGGSNDPRNIIWLCRPCHDEHEGQPISPDYIIAHKKQNVEPPLHGELWWIQRPDGEILVGIKFPGEFVRHYGTFLPKGTLEEVRQAIINKVYSENTRRNAH